MIQQDWQTVRNVLLIRLDNLGDVLLTTPAFHAVKLALPQARLTLLTSPVGAQIGALDPDIDEVIIYQAPWMDPWHKLPLDSQREQVMIAHLKAKHFDGAIIFTSFRQSSLPAAYLCYLADIPRRVAASIDGPGSLLTTRHKHPEQIIHEVERGLDLVRSIGIESIEQEMVLKVPASARQAINATFFVGTGLAPVRARWVARDFRTGASPVPTVDGCEDITVDEGEDIGCKERQPLIVVHPGCSMPARTYPWEMYAEVISLLVQQLDALVVVTGAAEEQALVKQILENVQSDVHRAVKNMAGVLSFPELCALIEYADLTVTNNTGPMHISAALKTPVIALFALTNPPEQWGPWHVPHRQLYHDVACRICYSRVCPYHHECLRLVAPQMVVDAAKELLVATKMQSVNLNASTTVATTGMDSDICVEEVR